MTALVLREILAADYARAKRRDDRAAMKEIAAAMRGLVAAILRGRHDQAH